MTDISKDAQMIEDEALGFGQWLAEHPADLREHLEQWDSDKAVRLYSEALGEVSLGLALAHLSAGQAKVAMDVMVEAMWLAHAAIKRAKAETEGSE